MESRIRRIILLVALIAAVACIFIGLYKNVWEPVNDYVVGHIHSAVSGEKEELVEGMTTIDIEENVSVLKLDMNLAEVNINHGEENKVIIYYNNEKLIPEIKNEDGTLSIINDNEINVKSFDVFNIGRNYKASVDVTLKDELDRLDLQIDLGDVNICGISFENADIELDLGDLDVEACTFNNCSIQCDLGDIDVRLGDVIDNYKVDASAKLGDIKVFGERYNKEYQSESGERSLSIKCDLGDIEIK